MSDDSLPHDFYEKTFANLDPEARVVMELRFGLDQGAPRTAQAVAGILRLPGAHVRRALARGIAAIEKDGSVESRQSLDGPEAAS